MLLKGKIGLIYGAGGAVGRAVARAFGREGARLFLSRRTLGSVEAVASDIAAAGATVEATMVDSFDEDAVDRYTTEVANKAGRIDVVLNATGSGAVQGIPLIDLKREDFASPIATWTMTQFLTARAAARHMAQERSGVILTLSASPARLAIASTGGFGVACAAIEGLTRTLAAELSPEGVRVICIRPHRIGDTLGPDPDFPIGRDEFRNLIENMTLLKTASDARRRREHGGVSGIGQCPAAMTGAVANLTCGMGVD